ncbi:MAG TPA: hypothetical protein VGF18_07720 [Candidatus Tumulicola sp.]|jgi:hypothetical protein
MALKEPADNDWTAGTKKQSGTNLRVTEDTALANRLRIGGLAEFLQSPQRGRQPASGRPKYILKLYPNADAPQPASARPARRHVSGDGKRIPWHMLASLAEAAVTEWNRQRSTVQKQLDEEIESVEAQLRSTRDRAEKKRLADALQTALHADENLEAEITKRVYAKLANSHESYADYVDAVDWSARRN